MSDHQNDQGHSKKGKGTDETSELALPKKPKGLDEPTGLIDTRKAPKDPVSDLFDALQNTRQKNSQSSDEASSLKTAADKAQQEELEDEITRYTHDEKPSFFKKKTISIWVGLTGVFLIIYSWGLVRLAQDEKQPTRAEKGKLQNDSPPRTILEGTMPNQAGSNNHRHTAQPQSSPQPNTGSVPTKVKRWQPKQAPRKTQIQTQQMEERRRLEQERQALREEAERLKQERLEQEKRQRAEKEYQERLADERRLQEDPGGPPLDGFEKPGPPKSTDEAPYPEDPGYYEDDYVDQPPPEDDYYEDRGYSDERLQDNDPYYN